MDKVTHDVRLQSWTSIMRRYTESGLTKKEWCRQNQIKLKTFYYWQCKLRLQAASRQQTAVSPASFAELRVAPSASEAPAPVAHPDVVIRNRTLTIGISNTASDRLLSLLGKVISHA